MIIHTGAISMRFRRPSFVAGWAAVALLAIVGFAAFSAPGADPDDLAEAAAASVGHTAGAYAGLTFALLGNDGTTLAFALVAEPEKDESEDAAEPEEAPEESSPSSPGAVATTGWLSEVEVRALVSQYFAPADVNQAVRIAWCESRFDPNHTDPRSGGIGLFNHLPRYWPERADSAGFPDAPATDPEASTAAAAREVYHGAGWEIFTCR
jgi:hypothetical protein